MTTIRSTSTSIVLNDDARIAGFGVAAATGSPGATDHSDSSNNAVVHDSPRVQIATRPDQSHFWVGQSSALGTPAPTYGNGAFLLDTPGEAVVAVTGLAEIRLGLAVKPEGEEIWGISLGVGDNAVIHIPQYQNTGRMLDSSMPIGEDYGGPVAYNFVVIEVDGSFLRLGGPLPRHGARHFHVYRTPDGFAVRLMSPVDSPIFAAIFPSLEAVQADYRDSIASEFGVLTMSSRETVPDWIREIPAVLTLDMMRSDGSIAHSFDDVIRLISDLTSAGAPENLLLYVPGWNGPYDSGGPTYNPAPEIGGKEGLRSALAAAREANYHIIVHTTGWGIDPYHPDIESMLEWVVRNSDGTYKGWQIDQTWLPPSKSFGYRPARQSLAGLATKGAHSVTLAGVPDWCEVGVRVGGLRGAPAKITATCNGRSIHTPDGCFADSDICDHPFPLRLVAGDNTVELTVQSGAVPASASPWVEFHRAFRPSGPGSSWTWPILRANMDHPDYIASFVGNVSRLVEEYELEAVHVDATWMGLPEGGPELLSTLRAALPNLVIGGEGLLHTAEMSVFNVIQNCKEDLIRGSGRYRPSAEQGALPVFGGRYEDLEWLGKSSPIASFARDYFRTYPHLCASHAFVPVGKVCNCYPPRQVHAHLDELDSVLSAVESLDAAPGLRLNYREFGLDDRSKEFILGTGR